MKWDEKKYRREIQREKERMTDREFFDSPEYLKLLKRLAGQITVKGFTEVFLFADPQNKVGGWYDGKKIALNTANDVTASFGKKELKSKSLIGYLGHECGHQNYSNISLREKYLSGIEREHRLYPHAPKAVGQEKQALRELREAFEAKDPYVTMVVLEAAAYLHNFLEDLYIEEQMCRRYPGSIRQGIQMNRKRWMELFASIKAQKEEGCMETAVALNFLTQLAISKNVNAWDGGAEAYTECMEACKTCLPLAYAEGESNRFCATNQILLHLWKFIKRDAETLKKKKEKEEQEKAESEKGQEQQQEGDAKGQEQPSGTPLNREPQDGENAELSEQEREKIRQEIIRNLTKLLLDYSPDYTAGQEKGNSQTAADVEWNGSWETEEIPNRTPAKTDFDAQRQEMENDKEISEIERKLLTLLHEMAKERVDQKYELALQKKGEETLRQIVFGQEHREVEKKLFRSISVSEAAVKQYEAAEPLVRQTMKRLNARLLPVLEKRRTRTERGLTLGRQMDMGHLYRRDAKVFQKRRHPGDEVSAAIALLVDQSGSMIDSGRLEYARLAALCLYRFGIMAEIPVAVYGHHTRYLGRSKEQVCLHSFAEFDSIDGKDTYRIMDMQPEGANRDGAALRFAGEILRKRTERKKLLILISDGLPNASGGYCRDTAKKDLKAVKKSLENQEIVFLAAAIGEDKEKIQEIYGGSFLNISEIQKLPEKLTKEILKKIG